MHCCIAVAMRSRTADVFMRAFPPFERMNGFVTECNRRKLRQGLQGRKYFPFLFISYRQLIFKTSYRKRYYNDRNPQDIHGGRTLSRSRSHINLLKMCEKCDRTIIAWQLGSNKYSQQRENTTVSRYLRKIIVKVNVFPVLTFSGPIKMNL